MKNLTRLFTLRKTEVIFVLVIIFVALVNYSKVPFIYFQQDEYMGFGQYISEGLGMILKGLGTNSLVHFIPISTAIRYILFSIIGLNYSIYNLVGLSFHLINAYLLYRISKYLFNNRVVSFISVIVFLSCYQAAELIMWPAASINSISLTFILIGWSFILKIRNSGREFRMRDGLLICLFFLLAVFSMEYAILMIFFFPFLVVLTNKTPGKHIWKVLFPIIVCAIIYFIFRFLPTLNNTSVSVDAKIPIFARLERFVIVPLVYMAQLFFGQNLLLTISGLFSGQRELVETTIFKNVASSIGFLIYLILITLSLKLNSWKTEMKKYLILILLFILFSSLPFTMVVAPGYDFSIIPSRYMYFGTIGYSLIIVLLTVNILNRVKVKTVYNIVILLILTLVVVYGSYSNLSKSNLLYNQGQVREIILKTISDKYPVLPKKVIFYFQSDTSYYGLSEQKRILPFQSGLGQTLLVRYFDKQNFPKEFFENRFLWELTSEGYEDFNGIGFGYFINFEKVADMVKTHDLPLSSVIAFRYDSQENKLQDISGEIKGRLEGDLANKKLVNPLGYKLTASVNTNNIFLASDGKRETFWSSIVSYAIPMEIEVSFKVKTKLAQIQIDSLNNKDQNEVGYKVLVLNDNGNWDQVFYAKRYPPNEEGLVNLYFKPRATLNVKIEQVGYHKYAPWVINELRLYQTVI